MSIKNYVDELESINLEIKRNNMRNKQLRTRAKELEKNISEYLYSKNQTGLKYKGQAILVESKEVRTAKKKKEKQEDVISLLSQLGVSNPSDAYVKLLDIQKGEVVEKQKIKFAKLPTK